MKDNPLEIVSKVWGEEVIIKREPYTVKVMQLKPGYRCSLHMHKEKEETFTLISGTIEITTINSKTGSPETTRLSKPGDSLTLKPMTPHTFKSLNGKQAMMIESSTVDTPSDSYRIFPSGLVNDNE